MVEQLERVAECKRCLDVDESDHRRLAVIRKLVLQVQILPRSTTQTHNTHPTMNNLLTIAELIEKLQEIAKVHGDRLPVVGVSDIERTEIRTPAAGGGANVIPAIRLVRN